MKQGKGHHYGHSRVISRETMNMVYRRRTTGVFSTPSRLRHLIGYMDSVGESVPDSWRTMTKDVCPPKKVPKRPGRWIDWDDNRMVADLVLAGVPLAWAECGEIRRRCDYRVDSGNLRSALLHLKREGLVETRTKGDFREWRCVS